MHTKRWTIAGTALATLALTFSSIGVVAQDEMVGVPTAPTGYAELDQALNGDFAGTTVSFQTQWIGGEGDNFAEAIADFQTRPASHIKVDSIGSSHETVLKSRVDGGAPPDMAVLAQPSVITGEYGADGKIVDIATIMDTEKLAAEHAATIGLYQPATASGPSPTRSTSRASSGTPSRPSRPRATPSPRPGTSGSRWPTRSWPTATAIRSASA